MPKSNNCPLVWAWYQVPSLKSFYQPDHQVHNSHCLIKVTTICYSRELAFLIPPWCASSPIILYMIGGPGDHIHGSIRYAIYKYSMTSLIATNAPRFFLRLPSIGCKTVHISSWMFCNTLNWMHSLDYEHVCNILEGCQKCNSIVAQLEVW